MQIKHKVLFVRLMITVRAPVTLCTLELRRTKGTRNRYIIKCQCNGISLSKWFIKKEEFIRDEIKKVQLTRTV